MKDAEIDAMITLLDDQDEEVWQAVRKSILEVPAVDMLPRLQEARAQNTNPLVQDRTAWLVRKLNFASLRESLAQWKEESAYDLVKGMCLLASYQNPDIDPKSIRHEIEQLYAQAWVDLGANTNPMEKIKLLNGAFFDSFGFRPTPPDQFHHIQNSCIDYVLRERKGNPISLCVLYMLIAQKMKMPVYGVNLPNLFVLIYDTADLRYYINVFNKGSIFTRHEIDAYLLRLGIEPIPPHYEPCNHEAIVRRVLRNMMVAYEEEKQPEQVQDMYSLLKLWS